MVIETTGHDWTNLMKRLDQKWKQSRSKVTNSFKTRHAQCREDFSYLWQIDDINVQASGDVLLSITRLFDLSIPLQFLNGQSNDGWLISQRRTEVSRIGWFFLLKKNSISNVVDWFRPLLMENSRQSAVGDQRYIVGGWPWWLAWLWSVLVAPVWCLTKCSDDGRLVGGWVQSGGFSLPLQ